MSEAAVGQRSSGNSNPSVLALVLRRWSSRAAAAAIAALVLSAAFASLLPHGPAEQIAGHILEPPSWQFPLGTDNLGRDQLSRLVHGGRISLTAGLVVGIASLLVGVPLGLLAGFRGGWVDRAITAVIDTFMAFPALLLAIAIAASLGQGLTTVIVAITAVQMPRFQRITRAQVLSLRGADFVRAAKSVGASPVRIVALHILPNAAAPIVIQLSIAISYAILAEASLSFLGLSEPPPAPGWGLMLNAGRGYLIQAPWLSVFPGLVIALAVLSFNALGDAIRDAFDPRLTYTYQ